MTFFGKAKGTKLKGQMFNDYDRGGLKMIDIQSFKKPLKIKWVNGNFS